MAGMLQFLNCSHSTSNQKLFMPKRQMNGLEAPRNSLDVPADSFQNLCSREEIIPYSFQVKQNSSTGASMKLLGDGEMPYRNEAKRGVPIIARLMGAEKFPSAAKACTSEESKGPGSRAIPTKELVTAKEFDRWNHEANMNRQELPTSGTSCKLSKSLLVEHPQDQRLQKFKKDFEAWEASKAWHSSRGNRYNRRGIAWNDHQILAQERLIKEKINRYTNAIKKDVNDTSREVLHHTWSRSKTDAHPSNDILEEKTPNFSPNNNVEAIQMQKFTGKSGGDHIHSTEHQTRPFPTRIMLLKPGPERFGDSDEAKTASENLMMDNEVVNPGFIGEEKEKLALGVEVSTSIEVQLPQSEITSFDNCDGSLSTMKIPRGLERCDLMFEDDEGEALYDMGLLSEPIRSLRSDAGVDESGIECLLEEVKERLALGMKTKRTVPDEVKGFCLDIPKSLNRSAKLIGRQARGGLMREMRLLWSESTRTRRVHVDRPGSGSDTDQKIQRLPPERQKNEFGNEVSVVDMHMVAKGGPRNSNSKAELSTAQEIIGTGIGAGYPNSAQGKAESKDGRRRTRTDDHSGQKLAMADGDCVEPKRHQRSRFNFKGRVSSLRHSLSLGGKLFGKKANSSTRGADEFGSTSTFVAIPSVAGNSTEQQNNGAGARQVLGSWSGVSREEEEASCQTTTNDSSPISTLDVPFTEEVAAAETLQVIASHPLPDVHSSYYEVPSIQVLPAMGSASTPDQHSGQVPAPRTLQEILLDSQEPIGCVEANATDEEDDPPSRSSSSDDSKLRETQNFLRLIMEAAGFFENLDGMLSMWESPAICIRTWVLDEIEELYSEQQNQEGVENKDSKPINVFHRLLFDLLNETLLSKLTSPASATTPNTTSGEELVSDVCRIICKRIHNDRLPPLGEDPINAILAGDLRQTPWVDMIRSDAKQISEDLDGMIMDELVQETVFDLCWRDGFTWELLADLRRP